MLPTLWKICCVVFNGLTLRGFWNGALRSINLLNFVITIACRYILRRNWFILLDLIFWTRILSHFLPLFRRITNSLVPLKRKLLISPIYFTNYLWSFTQRFLVLYPLFSWKNLSRELCYLSTRRIYLTKQCYDNDESLQTFVVINSFNWRNCHIFIGYSVFLQLKRVISNLA